MAKKGDLADAIAAALLERGIGISDAGEVLARAYALAETDACFVKVGKDEPLFVLRAQDRAAPGAVRDWAHRARNMGAADEKVDEAMACAMAMEAWARTHPPKVAD